jgi:hypothetical protein
MPYANAVTFFATCFMAMYRLLLPQSSAAIVPPSANRAAIACPSDSGLINGTISQKVKPNSRPACNRQMETDVANKQRLGKDEEDGKRDFVIKYCRACELSCPVGA